MIIGGGALTTDAFFLRSLFSQSRKCAPKAGSSSALPAPRMIRDAAFDQLQHAGGPVDKTLDELVLIYPPAALTAFEQEAFGPGCGGFAKSRPGNYIP